MRTVTRIILGAVLAVLLGFSPASAEFYVAGYAGGAFPNDQDVDVTGSFSGTSGFDTTLKDVDLDNSVLFGGKAGYFFESWPYFGLEVDGYHFTPDAGPQTVDASGTFLGLPVVGATINDNVDIGVTGFALNAILRGFSGISEAFPRGRLQSYIGAGPGVFIGKLESLVLTAKDDDTDTVVGGQGLVGMKFFLTKNLAFFAEYKYMITDKFEFKLSDGPVSATVKTSISAHLAYGGIAFHF